MADTLAGDTSQRQETAGALKNWLMVALTLVFVLLYGAALLGWLKPLADEKAGMRFEPIIFVIIGYYFGRLPAQQNERTLIREIGRQTQRADAAQHAKEQALQSREVFEEKVKNIRTALTSTRPDITARDQAESLGNHGSGLSKEEGLKHSIAVALKILNS
jgi:hypothetical protein